jgi:hypothetical protein
MAKGKHETAPEMPITGPIPEAGRIFFGAGKEASYRLARKGIIPTIETGTRNKLALMRVLQQRLTRDPETDKA